MSMQKILTFEETQKRHRELWMWLAEETRKRKEKVEEWEFFQKHKQYETPNANSWCCKLSIRINKLLKDDYFSGCVYCPIDEDAWGDERCYRGLYDYWDTREDWQEAAEIAEEIANLPFGGRLENFTTEDLKKLSDAGYGEIYTRELKERLK